MADQEAAPIETAPDRSVARTIMIFGTSDRMPSPPLWRIAYRTEAGWHYTVSGELIGGTQTHWRHVPPDPVS